jgi:HlyD family secretion protein
MKKRTIFLISFIIIVILNSCSYGEKKPSSEVLPTENEIQPVEAFGTVEVLETDDITIEYPVKIEKLLVVEGQKVKGGEPLAIVDFSETDVQKKNKEQAIASLRSETTLLQNNLNKRKESFNNNKDADLLKLQNKLEYSKKSYSQYLNELEEKKELMSSGAISLKDYQDYSKQADVYLFDIEDTELAIESLKTSKQDEIRQDEAAVNRNNLQLSAMEQDIQVLEEKLDKSCIKDDKIISNVADGVICSVDCRPGELKAPGERIFSIMNIDTIIVKANVDEQFINDIKPGAIAFITPESDRTKEYKGKVTFISQSAIQKNGETVIPVCITPDRADSGLVPGYNVQISVLSDY